MTSRDQLGGQAADVKASDSSTLYYFQFSLYSILVRFAMELGRSLSPDTSPSVELHPVDLRQDENLSEEYLKLSPKGQVPSLSLSPGSASPERLTDSREILNWLCKMQPELLPEAHREDIESHLNNFYAFHAKPLAIRPEEQSNGITNKAAAMLERTDISESHRRCLEIKSIYHDTTHANTLEPDHIKEVESQTRIFIRGLSELLRRRQQDEATHGMYLYGHAPTVLDAVATTLLARLMDMQRDDLLDDATVRDYATGVMGAEEWQRVMQGRRTVYDASAVVGTQPDPL